MTQSPVIVALDFATPEAALDMAAQLDPAQCRVKVGKELFTRGGPAMVEALHNQGFELFLDLKFHDIPNTVARACTAAADLGVWMVNVHASTGRTAMTQAAEALAQFAQRPLLTAVTVLTSFSQQELSEVSPGEVLAERVSRLANLAEDCGLDGVVCSPHEASDLSQSLGADFALVTPGVRPEGSAAGDQTRIMTPAQAIKAGSTYLVIGRPITQAPDPVAALNQINLSLGVA
ncbi:MAG: orotidine-5'-phosphate decarboxylase [Pseudomonadales bacterium]|jgi:orotidine-5'-phosphate decarboxylase